MKTPILVALKHGRERSVRNRHPWIFSGAVHRLENGESAGLCEVVDAQGAWLGYGFWNPASQLSVRIYSWDKSRPVDESLLKDRIDAARRLRQEWTAARNLDSTTNACRVFFSEADGISGLIADQYDDLLSVRFSAKALMPFADTLIRHLQSAPGVRKMHVVFDGDALEREGMTAADIPSWPVCGEVVTILENGARYEVSPARGQKTGFFLDQRFNRAQAAGLARGAEVLGCYCYTGAFEIQAALRGAAKVTGVDCSQPALDQARRHAELNSVSHLMEWVQADVPVLLRQFRDAGRTFDGIILDPPRFVFNAAQKERGMRAYKDINMLAMKLLRPGGWLATYSCSGLVSQEDFRTIVRWSAVDAGRDVRWTESSGQPFDHPVLATFPESEYLKGLICRVG